MIGLTAVNSWSFYTQKMTEFYFARKMIFIIAFCFLIRGLLILFMAA
jgi:hypothetical protein